SLDVPGCSDSPRGGGWWFFTQPVAGDTTSTSTTTSTARTVLRKLGTVSVATIPHFSAAATQCGATIHGSTGAPQSIARCWISGQTPGGMMKSIWAGVNGRGLTACVTTNRITVARYAQ